MEPRARQGEATPSGPERAAVMGWCEQHLDALIGAAAGDQVALAATTTTISAAIGVPKARVNKVLHEHLGISSDSPWLLWQPSKGAAQVIAQRCTVIGGWSERSDRAQAAEAAAASARESAATERDRAQAAEVDAASARESAASERDRAHVAEADAASARESAVSERDRAQAAEARQAQTEARQAQAEARQAQAEATLKLEQEKIKLTMENVQLKAQAEAAPTSTKLALAEATAALVGGAAAAAADERTKRAMGDVKVLIKSLKEEEELRVHSAATATKAACGVLRVQLMTMVAELRQMEGAAPAAPAEAVLPPAVEAAAACGALAISVAPVAPTAPSFSSTPAPSLPPVPSATSATSDLNCALEKVDLNDPVAVANIVSGALRRRISGRPPLGQLR